MGDDMVAFEERCEIYSRADLVRSAIPVFPIIAMTTIEEVCCNDGWVNDLHLPALKVLLNRVADKRAQLVTVDLCRLDLRQMVVVFRRGRVVKSFEQRKLDALENLDGSACRHETDPVRQVGDFVLDDSGILFADLFDGHLN